MKNLTEALAAFFANSPRKIEGAEIYGWCGLEGTGYIAEFNESEAVVVDVTDDEVGVEYHDFDNEIIRAWSLKATALQW